MLVPRRGRTVSELWKQLVALRRQAARWVCGLSWERRTLWALGVGFGLVVLGSLYEPFFPWPLDRAGIVPVAWAAQPAGSLKQSGGVQTPASGGGSGAAAESGNLDTRIEGERKDLEARIESDQKAADAKIGEELEGTKVLLGALVGLTALSSLIIGFVTYMSVKYARDEAKDQVELFRKKIEELENKFPEFTGFDTRIRSTLRDVELRLPPEADWNDDESFQALQEEEKQEILDDEIAISASVSVFALDRLPLLRSRLVAIYSAFARFYIARFNATPGSGEGDYVRALSYARRAIERAGDAAGNYRLRGAIYLARYYRGDRATPREDQSLLNQYLEAAQKDLETAAGRTDPVDAGAFYNLALLKHYKGNTAGAAETCQKLIGLRGKISPMHREKYLPDCYVNLACFCAVLAARATAPAERQRLSDQAVEAIRAGLDEFGPTQKQDLGLETLKKGIAREQTAGTGDLDKLEQPYRDKIHILLNPPAEPASENP